eukprot:355524-Chlamydomonas_euryale.AAC.4
MHVGPATHHLQQIKPDAVALRLPRSSHALSESGRAAHTTFCSGTAAIFVMLLQGSFNANLLQQQQQQQEQHMYANDGGLLAVVGGLAGRPSLIGDWKLARAVISHWRSENTRGSHLLLEIGNHVATPQSAKFCNVPTSSYGSASKEISWSCAWRQRNQATSLCS